MNLMIDSFHSNLLETVLLFALVVIFRNPFGKRHQPLICRLNSYVPQVSTLIPRDLT